MTVRRIAVLSAACAALLASSAAPAVAGTGRVALDVGLRTPVSNVDAGGASEAVALPNGGAALFGSEPRRGVVAAALNADGTLDRAFGEDGVAHVPVPGGDFELLSAHRTPDGRLLLVGSTRSRTRYELRQIAILRLDSRGALDTSFGSGGIARPGIQASCGGSCDPAAITADGSVVVTGNTGAVSPAIETDPNAPNDFAWVVARLLPTGALDPAFGQNGVAHVPGTTPAGGAGYGAAVGADGRITLLGGKERTPLVARLLPDGGADPAFAGGAPAAVPVAGALQFVVGGDGSATVLGNESVARLAADGRLDASFGGQGTVTLGNIPFAGLLAAPTGDVLVYRPQTFEPRPVSAPALVIDRLDASGGRTTAAVRVSFGGGVASFFRAFRRIPRVPPLAQNAFRVSELIARPDGSYLAAGGVSIAQYTGEGSGFSTARFAAAALTPALAVDASFGEDVARPSMSVRVAAHRTRTAYRLRGVAVRIRASGAGLALVRVRDARGRILAQGVQPVWRAGTSTVRVQIARAGMTSLRRGRPLSVRVTTRFRDVLGRTVSVRPSRGRLR